MRIPILTKLIRKLPVSRINRHVKRLVEKRDPKLFGASVNKRTEAGINKRFERLDKRVALVDKVVSKYQNRRQYKRVAIVSGIAGGLYGGGRAIYDHRKKKKQSKDYTPVRRARAQ